MTEEQRWSVQAGMNDCYRIIYEGKSFCAAHYRQVFGRCFGWLEKALGESGARRKVVVSHHCPTFRFQDPRFKDSQISSAFCADLDSFIESSGADCWIFGHTHYNGGDGQSIGSTRMLTNQLGYVKYGEHKAFRGDAFIEI